MKKFPYNLVTGEDDSIGRRFWYVGFAHDGMFIHNPRLSSCGRFEAKPKDYGLTDEQADILAEVNKSVQRAAAAALNAGCSEVQAALGVTDGGFAALFFSGEVEIHAAFQLFFAEYAAAQINFGE